MEFPSLAELEALPKSYSLAEALAHPLETYNLDLSSQHLSSLPPEIGSLSNLYVLDLAHNELSSLPPEIGSLTNLRFLNLSNNNISVLPREIGLLENLLEIDIFANPLPIIPLEVWLLPGLECVKGERQKLYYQSGKFDTIQVDGETTIRAVHESLFETFHVRHEQWYWDGVVADAIVFVTEDVSGFSKDDLIALVKKLPTVNKDTRFTVGEDTKTGHTFVNFNFRDDSKNEAKLLASLIEYVKSTKKGQKNGNEP